MTQGRVLIFEDNLDGHRAKYAAVLAQSLVQMNATVVMALPKMDDDSSGELLEPILPHVELFSLEAAETVDANARFKTFQKTVFATRPSHVYVPYADGLSQAWGSKLFPSRCFPEGIVLEGLMMRGSYAYPALSTLMQMKNWLSLQLIKRSRWNRIHQLDPLALECICRQGKKEQDRNFPIPEIIEEPRGLSFADCCSNLDLDPNLKYISCPGIQSQRKGIDLLLAAFKKLIEQGAEDLRLLVFGKQCSQISKALRSEYKHLVDSGRVLVNDTLLSERDFESLFTISDVICVPYPRHIGSASILIRSARMKKKVLSSDWGWLGYTTKKYAIGETCDVRCETDFSETLARVISPSFNGPEKQAELSEARKHFIFSHTSKNYSECFTRLYRYTDSKQAYSIDG